MNTNGTEIHGTSNEGGRAPAVLACSRAERHYAFARGLNWASIVDTSEKVAWNVDDVFRGRSFDASKAIVPAPWVGTAALSFLEEQDHLTLNHCRAFSYVHLLCNFEEFAPPHLTEVAGEVWHGDRTHLRALFRFSEEELKHQQLFRRAERVLEESCGYSFGRYFDEQKRRVADLTNALLGYGALPRFLILLAIEWGTQRHYVESVRDQKAERGDPLYADILKAHWTEEAQHTKSDTFEIARLASEMSQAEINACFDDLAAIGRLTEAVFVRQADKEVETLERVSQRRLPNIERAVLRDTLYRSLSNIVGATGLTHPRFAQVALELSPLGAANLGIGMTAAPLNAVA